MSPEAASPEAASHGRAPSFSSQFAAALLDRFVHLGVRHVVICPGSRSQALALAAAELERTGALELHVRIDERSAGFLALGLAVESLKPVVVVTTSGTAVANLHPAVLEAHHSGAPLILLTADRPEELRGIGSNQTTVQFGIFGRTLRRTRPGSTQHCVPRAAVGADLTSRTGLDGGRTRNKRCREQSKFDEYRPHHRPTGDDCDRRPRGR